MMNLLNCQGLPLEEALALFRTAGIPEPFLENVTPAKGTNPADDLRVIRIREKGGRFCLTVGRFPPERT